eukprot:scaffold19279_cov30-Phaeocystis_antarctica.AAC.1
MPTSYSCSSTRRRLAAWVHETWPPRVRVSRQTRRTALACACSRSTLCCARGPLPTRRTAATVCPPEWQAQVQPARCSCPARPRPGVLCLASSWHT